jgi:hypothetical protein
MTTKKQTDQQLVEEFYKAALFMLEGMEQNGLRWVTDYLREHVRCTTDLKFTDAESLRIVGLLIHAHPELKSYVDSCPSRTD